MYVLYQISPICDQQDGSPSSTPSIATCDECNAIDGSFGLTGIERGSSIEYLYLVEIDGVILDSLGGDFTVSVLPNIENVLINLLLPGLFQNCEESAVRRELKRDPFSARRRMQAAVRGISCEPSDLSTELQRTCFLFCLITYLH